MKGIVIGVLVLSSPLCAQNIPEIKNVSIVVDSRINRHLALKACFISTADIENNLKKLLKLESCILSPYENPGKGIEYPGHLLGY